MRMLRGFLALVLLLGTVPVVWAQADPAKEVADIRAKQGAAGAKGEVDGVLAPMADNVVFTAARPGFRIESKEAVRGFLTNLNSMWRYHNACSLPNQYNCWEKCWERFEDDVFAIVYHVLGQEKSYEKLGS